MPLIINSGTCTRNKNSKKYFVHLYNKHKEGKNMRINNYSNCNKSFGIRLNQNIVKDIHKSTKELIKEYGKNSPQVKEFSKPLICACF